MNDTDKLNSTEIDEILDKIEAHAIKVGSNRDGLKIGLLHAVHNSRIIFAQSYINSLKGQALTPIQSERLEALKRKLYIPQE